MRRFRAFVSYDGTDFGGWQSQPEGNTIQDAIESRMMSFWKKRVVIFCSGRTDAGVHARAQVFHFDLCETDLLRPGASKSQSKRKRQKSDGNEEQKDGKKSTPTSSSPPSSSSSSSQVDISSCPASSSSVSASSSSPSSSPSSSSPISSSSLTPSSVVSLSSSEGETRGFGSYNELLSTVLSTGLPPSIVIHRVEEVESSFDARESCVAKRYIYTINEGVSSPFATRFCWDLKLKGHRQSGLGPRTELNVAAMQDAANRLVGKHDFAAFSTMLPGDDRETKQEMFHLQVDRHSCELPSHYGSPVEPPLQAKCNHGMACANCKPGSGRHGVVTITAICTRYMYRMMRMVSGVLCDVGKGILSPEEVQELLFNATRTTQVKTAPPAGLCLDEVFYDLPGLLPV